MMNPSRNTSVPEPRVHGFDVLRGVSVCSMVLFHLCYDLKYLFGIPLSWFAPPFQDIWRASISWTFLFIAGCMCAHSHNNMRRALRYLAVAGCIFLVTSFASVDTPISFGIIYCMGFCTLVAAVLQKIPLAPYGPVAATILFAVFLLLLPISQGEVGFGPLLVRLPRALYETPYLSWLGFPGPGFVSSDYYPPIPFLFMYLTGVALGAAWKHEGAPSWLLKLSSPPLEYVGQHALEIYIIHQPVLLLIAMALSL